MPGATHCALQPRAAKALAVAQASRSKGVAHLVQAFVWCADFLELDGFAVGCDDEKSGFAMCHQELHRLYITHNFETALLKAKQGKTTITITL